MPGAHRDLSIWKPMMKSEMMKNFDIRNRVNFDKKLDNYTWMIPIDFRQKGMYYNVQNKHHYLNPKTTNPGKYGYNRAEALERNGNLKSQYNIAGGPVDSDFNRQLTDLENYAVHNKGNPTLQRTFKSQQVMHNVNGYPYYSYSVIPSMMEERLMVNELDVEQYIRRAVNWDDLFVRSST